MKYIVNVRDHNLEIRNLIRFSVRKEYAVLRHAESELRRYLRLAAALDTNREPPKPFTFTTPTKQQLKYISEPSIKVIIAMSNGQSLLKHYRLLLQIKRKRL